MFISIAFLVAAFCVSCTQSSESFRERRQAPALTTTTAAPAGPNAYSSAPVRLGLLANFPDPTIYYDAQTATWYALATNSAAGILPGVNTTSSKTAAANNIQLASSADYLTWALHAADALPDPGPWAVPGGGLRSNVWAPELIRHPSSGTYLLYYTASSAADVQSHCIGAATSTTITGPYTAQPSPVVCVPALGGAIDPSAFIDPADGQIYLAYKANGNRLGHGGECDNSVAPYAPTPILLQRMLGDGVTPDPAWTPAQLLDRTPADGPLVEAPSLVRVRGTYYLFFSSGCVTARDYTVKFATAPALAGPYTRGSGALLATGDFGLTAPGSATVRFAGAGAGAGAGVDETAADGEAGWNIAFHARVNDSDGGVRALFVAGLTFT